MNNHSIPDVSQPMSNADAVNEKYIVDNVSYFNLYGLVDKNVFVFF